MTMFMKFLWALNAFIGVQGGNILLCVNSCVTHYFYECKICALSTKLDKRDAFHKDWVWLDTEKDVIFSSDASAGNELATHGIFNLDEVCHSKEGQHGLGRSGGSQM